MEFRHISILLYSKFSPQCQNLMSKIAQSNINFAEKFSLQKVCIDNKKIRKKIQHDTKINITTVPCLLIVFPDGGVEKYDNDSIFQWIDNIIQQEKRKEFKTEEKNKEKEFETKENNKQKRIMEENKRKFEKFNGTEISLIDDLPEEEEDEDEDEDRNENDVLSDRHKTVKPKKQIRSDRGNYAYDKDLYQGPRPDTRRAKKSAIKNTIKIKSDSNVMTKAQEIAKSRKQNI